MAPVTFGMLGGGWRAEFFLRIAAALPERFQVTSVLVRKPDKAAALSARFGVKTVPDLDGVLADRPPFVVVSVPWPTTPVMLAELAERGVPALAETPPAPDTDGLESVAALARGGARIQVAEQYLFQPAHAARLALVASGKLGRVTQAQVSAAHGYHGTSLIRQFLGIGAEPCDIRAMKFNAPLLAGPGRNGPPAEEQLETSSQTIAWLDWGDRLGVFDFTGSQYFSWVRSPRLLVRGERGELNGFAARWLVDHQTPVQVELLRRETGQEGNLEGQYLEGYLAGETWLYRNPHVPGRLADDEIAIATCLTKMADYAAGGPSFYGVAEAAQDHYLGMLIDRAAANGETVRAAPRGWAAEV